MTVNQNKVVGQVLMHFSDADVVSESEIENAVTTFAILYSFSDEEKKELVRELQSRLSVRIDRGQYIQDDGSDHRPWYNAAKAIITPTFWNRYPLYLMKEKKWNQKLIDEMDRSTDEIMDLVGNPNSAKGFQRRGLCMGDIQSGKTANYIGLINKAADAGYKVIILLTGIIEKLRSQTQERVDTGFIGLDSAAFTRNNKDVWIGVGSIDPVTSAVAVTSTLGDFATNIAKKIVAPLNTIQSPVIFVLKKKQAHPGKSRALAACF